MANKQISQLPAASALQNSDLLVAEQNGVAKSVTGTVLLAMLDGHGGIANTSYTPPVSPSLQGTLTLNFADGTSTSIPIYNGAQGAQGAQGEQGERGAAFTYEDFTPEQIESLRGEQGIQGVPGNPGYVHIKWASVEPTSDADMGDIPDAWMGIYSGSSSTAPTAYTAYAWYKIKGETGARGFTGARGANGTKIYLSNAAPILYDNYYYFGLSQLTSPDGQIGVSPASGDLILYRNSYYSSTGITDSLRGVRSTWGYDIVLNTATDEQVQDAVDEYLSNHPTVTGTFSNEAKNALLTLLEKVAYTVSNGQTYLDALRTELFRINVDSISAVFTQGSAVIYDTDSLDTLKQYLVVTATYSDSTTEILSDSVYTLSGTLTAGTSTITVSYGGKSTTFTVNVTTTILFDWDYTEGLNGKIVSVGSVAPTMESDGLLVAGSSTAYSQCAIAPNIEALTESYKAEVTYSDLSAGGASGNVDFCHYHQTEKRTRLLRFNSNGTVQTQFYQADGSYENISNNFVVSASGKMEWEYNATSRQITYSHGQYTLQKTLSTPTEWSLPARIIMVQTGSATPAPSVKIQHIKITKVV